MQAEKRAAVFLDRDGTINEEVGYLDRVEKLRLIPGAAEAIRLLNEKGFKTVVVTNQSGVARGFFTEAFVETVHSRIQELLAAEGAVIDGFYYCPHHPTEGRGPYLQDCDCRKPAPGLLRCAAAEHGIDPSRSFVVGDTLKDIEAGGRVGIPGILVLTGYGREALAALEAQTDGPGTCPDASLATERHPRNIRPVHVAADLGAAVRWILRSLRP